MHYLACRKCGQPIKKPMRYGARICLKCFQAEITRPIQALEPDHVAVWKVLLAALFYIAAISAIVWMVRL